MANLVLTARPSKFNGVQIVVPSESLVDQRVATLPRLDERNPNQPLNGQAQYLGPIGQLRDANIQITNCKCLSPKAKRLIFNEVYNPISGGKGYATLNELVYAEQNYPDERLIYPLFSIRLHACPGFGAKMLGELVAELVLRGALDERIPAVQDLFGNKESSHSCYRFFVRALASGEPTKAT